MLLHVYVTVLCWGYCYFFSIHLLTEIRILVHVYQIVLVKSFVDLEQAGTQIGDFQGDPNISSYIQKDQQALIQITPKDFSFMDEQHMQEIFSQVYKSGIKVNLMQNTAISLLLCVDDRPVLLEGFTALILDLFEVEVLHHYSMKTVLNFTESDLLDARDGSMTQRFGNKLFIVSPS